MKDTVLITGGLGYVGGRIAQKLSVGGNYNLLLGTRHQHSACPSWIDHAQIITMDMLSGGDLVEACKNSRYIIHLAALNEIECAAEPERALTINTQGTLKLLRAAEQSRVEKIIYFSTAHIYGSPLVGTITEDTLPRPVHPYAITHKASEDFVLAAHDKKSLTGIVVRLSNGFGAPSHKDVNRWSLIANDLCKQAVTQRQLVLKSSGQQRRDFITLSDVGSAVDHFLKLPASQCGNGIFNVGGENSLTILEFSELVAERCSIVLGFKPPIARPEPRVGEVSEPLDYRIDKLKATGFSLKKNYFEEIDTMLRSCKEWFG